MLRNLLLVSASGLVLFSHQFSDTLRQPRLVGSLIRALIEFSVQITAIPVSYVEYSTVAVAVASHESGVAYAVLIYDKDDSDAHGSEFGQLIAAHALEGFLDEYGDTVSASVAHNLKAFQGFQYRIPHIIREVAHSVLSQFLDSPPVELAALVTDDSLIKVVSHSGDEVDEVAVLASVRPLLTAARDMLSILGDVPVSLNVYSDGLHESEGEAGAGVGVVVTSSPRLKPGDIPPVTTLFRLNSASLILRSKASTSVAALTALLARPLAITRRLCAVLGYLRGSESVIPFGGPVGIAAILGED